MTSVGEVKSRYDSYRCSVCGLSILVAKDTPPGICECRQRSTFVPDELPETLGARVRWQRQRYKLSLGDVSKETGIAKSHLSDIENDRNAPGILILAKIARALHCSLDWLAGDLA
jgi:ribosome-binding protein aMBF1 (putative translation factor)